MNSYDINPQIEKMLCEAMLGEQMTMRSYQIMAEAAPNAREQSQINKLRRDERLHYALLADIYEEITGVEFEIGVPSVSFPRDYCGMIKTAIYDELSAVHLYQELANIIDCARYKERIERIIDEEKHHARILAAIYQQCSHRINYHQDGPFGGSDYHERLY